jgi:hypothetical protein
MSAARETVLISDGSSATTAITRLKGIDGYVPVQGGSFLVRAAMESENVIFG